MSGSVASDRSGSERAVKRGKISMIFQRGLQQNGCPRNLNNVWLAWIFQSNVTFK